LSPADASATRCSSFGGVFGIGSKLFAIPWSALTLDADEKRFILDAPKERLENAPGFDKDHWPSMADQDWAKELRVLQSPAILGRHAA
jgi:hypothetical protein